VESFFDLGCGVGKVVMHMIIAGHARTATGIELDAGRHNASVLLAQELFSSGEFSTTTMAGDGARLRLLQGNMLGFDLSEAEVLYLNQDCFPEGTRRLLAQKIRTEGRSLRLVYARPAFEGDLGDGFVDEGELTLPMYLHEEGTWLQVYRRVPPT
jgi:hypothetical protein